jgi:hypothetical protein
MALVRAMLRPMSVSTAATYQELAKEYLPFTEALRAASPAESAALVGELERKARELLLPLGREALAEVAVWHADHFYCLLHALSFVDDASFAFVHAVGTALCGVLARARVSVASLIDNQIPHDRLLPLNAFFGAMGFVVASPELLAKQLAEHDGVVVDDVNGAHLPRYLQEATLLAMRLFGEAVAERLPVLWASGVGELEAYVALARVLEGKPYVGMFRNQPPGLEQAVQSFQTLTRQVALDPNY